MCIITDRDHKVVSVSLIPRLGHIPEFSVCMDCGRIQNWERIHDTDIGEDE